MFKAFNTLDISTAHPSDGKRISNSNYGRTNSKLQDSVTGGLTLWNLFPAWERWNQTLAQTQMPETGRVVSSTDPSHPLHQSINHSQGHQL
jgi:hypothetical protein